MKKKHRRAVTPLLASLILLASCSAWLGGGPPAIPVLPLPERPVYEETHAHELEWNESTIIYRAPEERGAEEELVAGFSGTAWLRFQEWLREVLARFAANCSALKKINNQEPEGCSGVP